MTRFFLLIVVFYAKLVADGGARKFQSAANTIESDKAMAASGEMLGRIGTVVER